MIDNQSKDIVAALGKPIGPVGWSLPVLRPRETDIYYVLGDDSNSWLRADELHDLDHEGRISLLSKPTASSVSDTTYRTSESVSRQKSILEAPEYVFYFSRRIPTILSIALHNAASSIEWRTISFADNELCESYSAHCIEGHELARLLTNTFDNVSLIFRREFREKVANQRESLCLSEDHEIVQISKFLWRISPDRRRAERATICRALSIAFGEHPEQLARWLEFAAKTWILPSNLQVWLGKLQSELVSVELASQLAPVQPVGSARNYETVAGNFTPLSPRLQNPTVQLFDRGMKQKPRDILERTWAQSN